MRSAGEGLVCVHADGSGEVRWNRGVRVRRLAHRWQVQPDRPPLPVARIDARLREGFQLFRAHADGEI